MLPVWLSFTETVDPNQIFQAFFGGGNMGGFTFGGHSGAGHFSHGGHSQHSGFPGFSFQFG